MTSMEAALDARDRKLAFLLARNCRTSLKDLGRELNLSPDTVRYRIERLEKAGVVRGYTVIPNPIALGEQIASLFVSFQNLTKEVEEKIVKLLREREDVVLAYRTEGSWDMVFWIDYKSVYGFYRFLKAFKEVCGGKLGEYFYHLHVEEYKFRQAPEVVLGGQEMPLLQPGKADASFAKEIAAAPPIELVERPAAEIDGVDWGVLHELSRDARASLTDLARKSGLSVDQIRYRVRRLIKEGVLQAFWGVLDLGKFGLQRFDMLVKWKNMSPETEKAMRGFFLNHPNVIRAIVVCGPYDLWVNLACEDLKRCHEIVGELNERFEDNIAEVDMLIVFEELKFGFEMAKMGEPLLKLNI